MNDEVGPGWSVDPETRAALRLSAVRAAIEREAWEDAVIEVEELLDEVPDHPEALFLLAECLLELGDPVAASRAYAHKLTLTGDDPETLTGLAVARFDACDLPGAVEAAREAVRLAPDAAEAHYYLSLALTRLGGRNTEAMSALLAAHQLSPETWPIPLELGTADWELAVQEALALLPPELSAFWGGVPFVLLPLPDLEELRATDPPVPPTVAGLYEGAPPDEPDPDARPDRMRLFTDNLARFGEWDALVDELAATLAHEAEDWLGELEDEYADDEAADEDDDGEPVD